MKECWLDISDSSKWSESFWSRHCAAIDQGKFWADELKALKGEPARRLQLAYANLPLPAAFDEAAVALRALIRGRRKNRENFEREIASLYWLAAISSFHRPYSEVLKEPGYNVLESIPGHTVANLPFDYKTLGYRELALLKKTDIRWITELWGEPEAHTTLNALHHAVWAGAEQELKKRRDQEFCAFM